MNSGEKLSIDQKAGQISLGIYEATKNFPPEGNGIASEMRKKAASIQYYITEGHRRQQRQEHIHFLLVAQGSCRELEILLSLSRGLGFIDEVTFADLSQTQNEISGLLRRMITPLSLYSQEKK